LVFLGLVGFSGSGLFLRYWLVFGSWFGFLRYWWFSGLGWFFWIVAHQQNKDMQATKVAQEQIHLIYTVNFR
jgi:hypothetical protein